MLKRLTDWFDAYLDNRRLYQAARFWARQGSVTPYADAELERFYRLKLEECRAYVCKRYIEDPTKILDDLKSEWIEANITPMLKSSFCKQDGKTLLAAITGMGEEIFFGRAARLRRLELDNAVEDARYRAVVIKRNQRQQALRI